MAFQNEVGGENLQEGPIRGPLAPSEERQRMIQAERAEARTDAGANLIDLERRTERQTEAAEEDARSSLVEEGMPPEVAAEVTEDQRRQAVREAQEESGESSGQGFITKLFEALRRLFGGDESNNVRSSAPRETSRGTRDYSALERTGQSAEFPSDAKINEFLRIHETCELTLPEAKMVLGHIDRACQHYNVPFEVYAPIILVNWGSEDSDKFRLNANVGQGDELGPLQFLGIYNQDRLDEVRDEYVGLGILRGDETVEEAFGENMEFHFFMGVRFTKRNAQRLIRDGVLNSTNPYESPDIAVKLRIAHNFGRAHVKEVYNYWQTGDEAWLADLPERPRRWAQDAGKRARIEEDQRTYEQYRDVLFS